MNRIHPQSQSIAASVNIKSSTGQPSSSASQAAASTRTTAQDQVSISNAGIQLSSSLAVRQEKVDALRSQVQAGTYTVDAKAVASAIANDHFWSPSLFTRE